MKKLLAVLLICASLFAFVYYSSSDEEIEYDASPTPVATATPTPTTEAESEENEEEEIIETVLTSGTLNPLTGLDDLSDEAQGTRPIAVMINNVYASLPQYGISDADILIEMPVEGGLTRLMALYSDYTAVPDICSVRSCRYYYAVLSESFDALYAHWGYEKIYAAATLNELDVDNLDASYISQLFGRDQDRLDDGYSLEHTGVFYGTELAEYLVDNEYRLEREEDKTDYFFNFNSVNTAPDGEALTEFTLDFGAVESNFEYDEETKTYFKDRNGSDQVDGDTGLQLEFTNILVLVTDVSTMEDSSSGLQEIDITGTNKTGYYISEGQIVNITWTKETETSSIILYDENGDELVINTGKTYIAIAEFSYGSSNFY